MLRAQVTWSLYSGLAPEFEEFKFFSLQAKFLNGTLSEKDFRRQMGDPPDWKISTEYIIGLHHWLNRDVVAAIRAFERCLQIDPSKKSRSRYSPIQWAKEDLARIRDADANRVNAVDNQ